MKKPPRTPVATAILAVALAASTASTQTVTFSARNASTGQAVTLASAYIENLATARDTILINPVSFNSGALSVATDRAPAGPLTVSRAWPSLFTDRALFRVFTLAPSDARLTVYNILGQRAAEWRGALVAGEHEFALDGGPLASGVYILAVEAGGETRSLKAVKLGRGSGGGPASLSPRGSASSSTRAADKAASPEAGPFRVTGYAHGFHADTLMNVTVTGGENLEFTLAPRTEQPVLARLYKGFNFLGKFTKEWSNEGYFEDDFSMVRGMGFNFVRLPVDYRTYTVSGDWTRFVERGGLEDIDEAVAWGKEYGVHVNLNLHRGPGYCVNPPSTPLPASENLDLWTNSEAQRVFALHWGMFARRYKDAPDSALSFNLINEPPDRATGPVYVNAMKQAVAVIRAVTPNRTIFVDGKNYANDPVEEFVGYHVVQSPHFYNPFQVTHYKAEWVNGSDTWPVPVWPPLLLSTYLYASGKSPWNTPLKIAGAFPAGTTVTILVHQVSSRVDLSARADGVKVWEHSFTPGPGTGEWKEVIYAPEWKIYQNIYDRRYAFTLASDAAEVSFHTGQGDWMTFTELSVTRPAGSGLASGVFQPGIGDWGVPQTSFTLSDQAALEVAVIPRGFEHVYDRGSFLKKWTDLKARGVAVHGGEWGVYNKTPHDVALAFVEDRLKAFDAAGIGWAMWNFRGSFGPLDSGRPDVVYEDYYGYSLDREMLDLLQTDW